MKLLLYLFMPVVMFTNFGPKKGTLTIKANSCTFDKGFLYVKNAQLLQDGKTVDAVIEDGWDEVEVNNLPYGNYTLVYDNIYNQKQQQDLVFNKKENTIEVCADQFVDTGVETTFEQLKGGQRLTISFAPENGVDGIEMTYHFSSYADKWMVEVNNGRKISRRTFLSAEQLQKVVLFERQLRLLSESDGECTTTDLYKLNVADQQTESFTDETCKWHGKKRLDHILFGTIIPISKWTN